MKVFSNTTPFISLCSVNLLHLMLAIFGTVAVGIQVMGTLGILAKARTQGLIPHFSRAAFDMRDQGIYFSEGLVHRIAARLGESN